MKNNQLKYAATSILYFWIGFFILIPLVLIFSVSLLSYDENKLFSLPITFANYQTLFSPLFIKVFFRSFFVASITSILCLSLAYPFSYFLAQKKQRKLLFILVLVPFWTSSLVRSYALIGLLKTKGIINTLLLTLGIIHTPLAMLYTNAAVIIGLSYNLLPFMILPLYNNFERLDKRQIEVSYDLGANHLRLVFYILIPQTLPGIISGVAMVFFPAMTLFYISDILGGAKSLLLGNYIENQFLLLHNWPAGAASSVLLTLLMLLLIFIYSKKTSLK